MSKRTVGRRHIDQKVRDSEKMFRTLFDESIDAIFIVDAETGIIADCNQSRKTSRQGKDILRSPIILTSSRIV